MDPFLWKILKFTKKLKMFGEDLIREKDFLMQKNYLSTCFSSML